MELNRPSAVTVLKGVAVVAFLGVLAALAVAAVPQLVGADHSFVVLSSSMAPAIGAGDVVIVEDVPPERIQAGDIITYRDVDAGAETVTHRVVEVRDGGDSLRFVTKGDANDQPDDEPIPARAVVGTVSLTIPLVGYVVDFANTGAGIATLVVVPAVLLVASEVWDLYSADRNRAGADDRSAGGEDG